MEATGGRRWTGSTSRTRRVGRVGPVSVGRGGPTWREPGPTLFGAHGWRAVTPLFVRYVGFLLATVAAVVAEDLATSLRTRGRRRERLVPIPVPAGGGGSRPVGSARGDAPSGPRRWRGTDDR
jgi:hypothetical protein